MFVSESTSFHLIASFSFELILMPEMLLEEGYVSNLSDMFQQMAFFSFLPCLMCACYDPELYMCFVIRHAIFTGVYAMYFCDLCGD